MNYIAVTHTLGCLAVTPSHQEPKFQESQMQTTQILDLLKCSRCLIAHIISLKLSNATYRLLTKQGSLHNQRIITFLITITYKGKERSGLGLLVVYGKWVATTTNKRRKGRGINRTH